LWRDHGYRRHIATGKTTRSFEAVPEKLKLTGDALSGEQVFYDSGCIACHSTGEETIIGPGLAGIYVRAGESTSLDAEAYIVESIREPGAFAVDGFPVGLMPSFDVLCDDDIYVLVEYLKTLE